MPYYICESEFDCPDPDDPSIYLTEIDIYAWISIVKQQQFKIESHRLSMRKRIATGEYEIYRQFRDHQEVIFKSKDLKDTCDQINEQWELMHGREGYKRDPDVPCKHVPGEMSFSCHVSKRARNRIKV